MLTAIFTLALALASVATANPIKAAAAYPPQTLQQGYRLVVNVTDPARDFKSYPVHGLQVTGIHAGAGLLQPTVDKQGSIYFTTTQNHMQLGITGSYPYSWSIGPEPRDNDKHLYGLGIDIGEGDKGFGVHSKLIKEHPCSAAYAPRDGTYAVCDNGFEAPEFARYEVDFIEGASKDWYKPANVPKNCVAVTLLPECATLDLAGATYPHNNVRKSVCYTGKVSEIKWSKYARCT